MKKIALICLLALFPLFAAAASESHGVPKPAEEEIMEYQSKSISEMMSSLAHSTVISALFTVEEGKTNEFGKPINAFAQTWGSVVMFAICFLLLYCVFS